MANPTPLRADPGFGIYVHWPFCLSKCPYCDFNSHVRSEPVDEKRFVAAITAELAHRAALTPGRVVRSVYFGGGTPSLMKAASVAAILEAIGRLWKKGPQVEVTLEANPSSVEAGRFRDYRAVGVNRVSIGVQSFNDADLKMLGRLHTGAEASAALDVAASVFERYSFDLIYARPQQSVKAWRTELKAALARGSDHLSLYQLTIEPDTIFERLNFAGKLPMPDADMGRAFWDATQELTAAAGLAALRSLEPRKARRREPAQSHLLALRRICRSRAGGAWPHRDAEGTPRSGDRAASRNVADGRRGRRPRARRGRDIVERGTGR